MAVCVSKCHAATLSWSGAGATGFNSIAIVKQNVIAGLQWWKDTLVNMFPSAPANLLNFDINWKYAEAPVHTGYEPIARQFWPDVLRHAGKHGLIGASFAAARRDLERRWGCHNLEVPLSLVCGGEAFAWCFERMTCVINNQAPYGLPFKLAALGWLVRPETYARVHLAGRKRHFEWRLLGPERAARAGMRRVGIGALMGLHDDWRCEALAVAAHARFLMRRYWRSPNAPTKRSRSRSIAESMRSSITV